MNIENLQAALADMKIALEAAIITGTLTGRSYINGREAKEALIRSQRLILRLHEVVKISLASVLQESEREFSIFPPIGQSSPELLISGFIKAKKQDIVALLDGQTTTQEQITDGLLTGAIDRVGKRASERSIIVGVRSQLSSIDKNFDTLMERTFAETLNLRLRLPRLVMGEVYLIPVVEYDDTLMLKNKVGWKPRSVKVDKFIRTFLGISGRAPGDDDCNFYKYERTALILVDFREMPPRLFLTMDDLRQAGHVTGSVADFSEISPINFAEDLIETHSLRHSMD